LKALMDKSREMMKELNNVTADVEFAEATVAPSLAEEHAFGTAKLLDQTSTWSKQAVGGAALLALGALWTLSSVFD
jgi:phosphatidylinositol glycan class K